MGVAHPTQRDLSTTGLWPPTWPMGLTMLRLLLLPFFIYCLVAGPDHQQGRWRWLAITIFAVMSLTDKLDGYLARKLNQASKLGAILDPLADKLLITCAVFLLSIERIAPVGFAIPWWVVLCVYGKDLLVVLGLGVLIGLIGPTPVSARWSGKVSTVLQLALVLLTLLARDVALWAGESVALVATRALWWAVAGMALLATADYVLEGVRRLRSARAPAKTTTVSTATST
jgi:CDP-diacylglycerol--glycerol-3-phosphate 3-phosphatidyltransferase